MCLRYRVWLLLPQEFSFGLRGAQALRATAFAILGEPGEQDAPDRMHGTVVAHQCTKSGRYVFVPRDQSLKPAVVETITKKRRERPGKFRNPGAVVFV